MISNAWGDSIFPPNQIGEFFDGLTGPKLLEMRPGDHATPEGTGVVGLPNAVWSGARDWLAHHLTGADNGIDRKGPVVVLPKLQVAYESYPSWSALAGSELRLHLTDEDWLRNGKLTPEPATGWTTRTNTGIDSGANAGILFLSPTLEQFAKLPPTVSLPLLNRFYGTVWKTERFKEARQVRGVAKLHVRVTPTAADGTLFAYLYDVDALGIGRLITHTPYAFFGKERGKPFTADLTFQATAYDVPAGHHLALVVDTTDPLYKEHNPARLSIPLR